MKEYRLTGTRILIKQKEAETQTKGGIFLPDQVKFAPLQGTLKMKGPAVALNIEIGDMIFFDRFAGTEVILDEERFLILDEQDVLIILKKQGV